MGNTASIVLRLLSLAVQVGLPLEEEIENAIHEHWGKDHIQQLAQGAEHLKNIAATIADAAASKTEVVHPELAGSGGVRPQPMETHKEQNGQQEPPPEE